MRSSFCLSMTLLALTTLVTTTRQARSNETLDQLAARAVDSDPSAQSAIEELRCAGPDGLAALLNLDSQDTSNADLAARWKGAVDAVSGQRDGHISRLYWYTDLEAALEQAKRLGRPALSLRLLGKLTDELSCANSRFFRSTLYANRQVSQQLRDRFVLHWHSVRPVPKVTIDFGDGRKLERTITGNSVHYILAPDGHVIDALPGLYGPAAFLAGLERAEGAFRDCSRVDDPRRSALLARYHAEAEGRLTAELLADAAKLNRAQPNASPIAVAELLDGRADDAAWRQVTQLHATDAVLDDASIALIRAQFPNAFAAGARALSKMRVEDPILARIGLLQRSIALDTVRNEYLLHRQLHGWLAQAPGIDLESLNERVYAELFLTPSTDPWLGLAPPDVYTAIAGDGRRE